MTTKKDTKDIKQDNLEELLFENGPTISQVEDWKKEFGNVYLTEFDGDEIYIWRAINRQEFKEIMNAEQIDALYKEERVCEICVLWPKDYTALNMTVGKAGAPTLISEQIMEKSGFAVKSGPVML